MFYVPQIYQTDPNAHNKLGMNAARYQKRRTPERAVHSGPKRRVGSEIIAKLWCNMWTHL